MRVVYVGGGSVEDDFDYILHTRWGNPMTDQMWHAAFEHSPHMRGGVIHGFALIG